jgi:hypothetical protein
MGAHSLAFQVGYFCSNYFLCIKRWQRVIPLIFPGAGLL